MARPRTFISIPARNYKFGQQVVPFMRKLLHEHVCQVAAATAEIEINATKSITEDFGLGFVTRMQTFGEVPRGFSCAKFNESYIVANNKESCKMILAPFGLSIEDIIQFYGTPPDGEKYSVSLMDAVKHLQAKSNNPEVRNLIWES